MRVIMTQGAYRYRPEGEKSAVVVQLGDPAFDLPEDKAARLVSLGVAKYAPQAVATVQIQAPEAEARETQPTQQADAKDESEAFEINVPEYSVKMTVRQLKELMDSFDLPYEEGMTKAQMVERLDSFFDDYRDGEEGSDDLPGLSAQMPEL